MCTVHRMAIHMAGHVNKHWLCLYLSESVWNVPFTTMSNNSLASVAIHVCYYCFISTGNKSLINGNSRSAIYLHGIQILIEVDRRDFLDSKIDIAGSSACVKTIISMQIIDLRL